jgi:hypothetical protein
MLDCASCTFWQESERTDQTDAVLPKQSLKVCVTVLECVSMTTILAHYILRPYIDTVYSGIGTYWRSYCDCVRPAVTE